MRIVGLIPARMASSRFPGKPLAKICDIPMIGHVYFRSKMCRALDEVYVATCDKAIADYVESIGGKTVMTADTHERASDRTAEAMIKIERESGTQIEIAVMIQGDEPMLHPDMIQESLKPFEDKEVNVVNLMSRIKSRAEQEDPNEVKVVTDLNNYALYFTREAVPSWKKGAKEVPMHKQVCIIPFRRDFLLKFNALRPSPLEAVESIDMLRVLEHGYKVKMVLTERETYSVDTPADLAKVQTLMAKDILMAQYE
ncbi:MAG: 3-deoxy-manno-octulosonate cytidylyltransferase [Pseudomonadota bacterium]